MAADYKAVKASVERRVRWVQSFKDAPCTRCGQTLPPDQMHFHHRDPATKLFSIAQGSFRHGRAVLLAEIAKCDLLCKQCHDAHHVSLLPGCGTRASYIRGCRCPECRRANREYVRPS